MKRFLSYNNIIAFLKGMLFVVFAYGLHSISTDKNPSYFKSFSFLINMLVGGIAASGVIFFIVEINVEKVVKKIEKEIQINIEKKLNPQENNVED